MIKWIVVLYFQTFAITNLAFILLAVRSSLWGMAALYVLQEWIALVLISTLAFKSN
jgi:hypothetical protein